MSFTNYTCEVYEEMRKAWGVDPVSAKAENEILNLLQDLMDEYENEISAMNEEILLLEEQIAALV